MRNQIEILGVNVDVTNQDLACRTLCDWIDHRNKAYVCVVPVSTVVECQRDSEYKKVVNNADMATPDGVPLTWVGRLKGKREIARTYGPDLMLRFCQESLTKGYRHYLYGGSERTNELLADKLKSRFSQLNIVGRYAPPFRSDYHEDDAILEKINEANPDVVWVGLGSPKQDFWMYHYRNRLNAPVIVGVGAAFDFLAGTKPQAPRWMQKAGLEWFFRFCCEPRRLWRRYLIGNTQFVYWLTKDFLKGKPQNNT